MSFLGDIAGGATNLYGYNELLKSLSDDRDAVSGAVAGMQNELDSRTQFKPWSVTSNLGSVGQMSDGRTAMNLSPEQRALQEGLFFGASGQLANAVQNPATREKEVYDRMMAAWQPGQDRQAAEMRERLARQGRSGIRSERYGGSPEELAMAKAQQEGQQTAMLKAMGFTQDELNNQFERGQGLLSSAYLPQKNLQAQAGIGTNLKQLQDAMQIENAGMFAQLGLGGIGTDLNYSNLEGQAFGDMIAGGSNVAQGAGDWISDALGWG